MRDHGVREFPDTRLLNRNPVNGLSFSTRLRSGAALQFGVVDSNSTAGIADYRQFTLDFRLDRLR